jgi:hypothetical protein
MKNHTTIALAITLMTAPALRAEDAPHEKSSMADCPMMKEHTTAVNERGDKAMGFSHEKTTHHFRLLIDGGAIEVTANDTADTLSREQIRGHLGHIAKLFAEGNFAIPMLVHAQKPPGSEVMQKSHGQIQYKYEEMPAGGRVRITTKNLKALRAVHEFLRFQIKDHQTGDLIEVEKAP